MCVGPMAVARLNPDATLGPIVAWVYAPIFFVAGAIAGVAAGLIRLSIRHFVIVAAALAALAIAVIVVTSLPADRYQARIIEGTVIDCRPPQDFVAAAVASWTAIPGREQWWRPRAGWKEDIPRMLRGDRGVVLTLRVTASREIYVHRKPWNRGTLYARSWDRRARTENYFARFRGADCAAYRNVPKRLYEPEWEVSTVSPPDILPTFLGLYVLNDKSSRYQRFTTH